MSTKKDDDKQDNDSKFLKNLEKKIKDKDTLDNKDTKNNKNKLPKGKKDFSFLFIFLMLMGILGVILFSEPVSGVPKTKVSYSEFIKSIESKKIKSVDIINQEKIVYLEDGVQRYTNIPYLDQDLIKLLLKEGVEINAKIEKASILRQLLISIIPWILIFLIFYFFIFRAARSGKGLGDGFNFGKSRAKLVNKEMTQQRFNDVQGCDEAKEELLEVVSFLKDPKKYIEIGAKIPRGVLLVGPPGNGKTLLAKAVAGEANVPFFFISGSDFVEMFVGVGASRVRDLFQNAKKNTPCIIFIDEIDAVGRTRGIGHGGGNDEREQTLNQLLVELDGFDTHKGMIVLAATNRADVLDKALLRPGRFDRQVFIDLPDIRGRKNILTVHAKKIKLNKTVDLDRVARSTPGFSGADLANLVNEAALISARMNKKKVGIDQLDEARDKIIMGPQRGSMLMDEDEKKMTAYHEGGHALVSLLLKNTKSLHKITIIPRGRSLGLTSFLPHDGQHSYSKTQLIEEIMVSFGGRAAEEIMFGEISTGASNDIKMATKIAKGMVMQFGMSKLGMVSYTSKSGYLMENDDDQGFSEEYAKEIDAEVSKTLNSLYTKTVKLLSDNKEQLVILSEDLLEKETMDVEEVYELLKIKKPKKKAIK